MFALTIFNTVVVHVICIGKVFRLKIFNLYLKVITQL